MLAPQLSNELSHPSKSGPDNGRSGVPIKIRETDILGCLRFKGGARRQQNDAEEAGELKIDQNISSVPQDLLRAVSSTGTRWALKTGL